MTSPCVHREKWRVTGICCATECKLLDFQILKALGKILQFKKKKKKGPSAYFCASNHLKFLAENSPGKIASHRYHYARQEELQGLVPSLESFYSPKVRPVAVPAPALALPDCTCLKGFCLL